MSSSCVSVLSPNTAAQIIPWAAENELNTGAGVSGSIHREGRLDDVHHVPQRLPAHDDVHVPSGQPSVPRHEAGRIDPLAQGPSRHRRLRRLRRNGEGSGHGQAGRVVRPLCWGQLQRSVDLLSEGGHSVGRLLHATALNFMLKRGW